MALHLAILKYPLTASHFCAPMKRSKKSLLCPRKNVYGCKKAKANKHPRPLLSHKCPNLWSQKKGNINVCYFCSWHLFVLRWETPGSPEGNSQDAQIHILEALGVPAQVFWGAPQFQFGMLFCKQRDVGCTLGNGEPWAGAPRVPGAPSGFPRCTSASGEIQGSPVCRHWLDPVCQVLASSP